MTKTLTFAFITAALSLSACGGEARPTADELSTALSSSDSIFGTALSDKAADCVADVLVASDVSNKGLKAVAEGDVNRNISRSDMEALDGPLTAKITACVTQ